MTEHGTELLWQCQLAGKPIKATRDCQQQLPLKVIFHVVDVFILFFDKRSHLPSCAIVSFLGDDCDKYRNSSSHLPAKEAETDERWVTVGDQPIKHLCYTTQCITEMCIR